MLEPDSRMLLLDSLRPPDGYELSAAVGTTYTLDLVALMVAALPFTFFDSEDREGANIVEPLPLLEALRRNAGRITLFCNAGKIGVPKEERPLFAYVEESVYEAFAPTGAFHPKLWALRYTSGEAPVLYRLICLSRNLTFDKSWDTVLVLDGELLDRRNGISANRPLSDFITALPSMATRPLADDRETQVSLIADEVKRVRWQTPEGFTDTIRFWPLGIPGYSGRGLLDGEWRQRLTVSPFLTQDAVRSIAKGVRYPSLVSRQPSLDSMPAELLEPFGERIYVLNEAAEPEATDDANPRRREDRLLRGLHAKLYVTHSGFGKVQVLTGSANATGRGLHGNVEFMVELEAERRVATVDRLLPDDASGSTLRNLLVEYERGDVPEDGTEPTDEEKLERALEAAEEELARWQLSARVHTADEKGFLVDLSAATPLPDIDGVSGISVHPLSPGVTPTPLEGGASGVIGTWGPMDIQSLSAFFVFTIHVGAKKHEHRFVRSIPLDNAPEGRRDAILRTILRDRGSVLRYLMLLAASDGESSGASSLMRARDLVEPAAAVPGLEDFGPTLFEALVRALDRDPKRLRDVNRLVTDLKSSKESEQLLPPGFDAIWAPVWEHAQQLLAEGDAS